MLVGAGTNKQHQTTKNTAKLDRESEELKHDKVSLDVGKIIQQGRQAKGLSQKDLATVSGCLFFFLVCQFSFRSGRFVLVVEFPIAKAKGDGDDAISQ